MAKTKEMLSERYLKKDLAYNLQTWFVDWSWDPLDAYCFWIPPVLVSKTFDVFSVSKKKVSWCNNIFKGKCLIQILSKVLENNNAGGSRKYFIILTQRGYHSLTTTETLLYCCKVNTNLPLQLDR